MSRVYQERARTMSAERNDFNASIIDEFRANGGHVGGPFANSPLLLLHHTGARSGASRISPLGYFRDRDRYFIVASNGGSATSPDWYHNLKAHPVVSIEVGTGTVDVVASEATGQEREQLFAAATAQVEQLAEYQASTGRLIPVMVLTPQ